MNKRLIARTMRLRAGNIKQSGGYFFRAEFDHILRGVLFEYVPRGVYVWNFRFPLFDFFGENLLYSDRLRPPGFIEKGQITEDAMVEGALAHPDVQEAFRPGPPMSLEQFFQFLEGSTAMLNEHAQLIFAAGLVMAGEEVRAKQMLAEILPRLPARDAEHCRRLQEALQKGLPAAVELLDKVRQQNLRAFKLI
ncbi:hypothetical protein L2Y96_18995 [Luteibacter aegosomaticola]|uniref:hypothetical protein n=1 Tax=Luteibacter aegosomaticola TaxID=2911538 RepID=UPI001FF9D6AF|nr:hypothetical protein [Luteibacter aegosomaticola]UPG89459.1 hypothetical protein L2Y96_18995 [Luteibacter aegosomaticola]